jgi:guanine deaminase
MRWNPSGPLSASSDWSFLLPDRDAGGGVRGPAADGSSPNVDAMREAIELALRGVQEGSGGPFGSVVVREGVVVGRGWNRVTSLNDPTAHAEVVAIRDACQQLGTFDLSGCEIYASCEPCPMCLAAIYWSRIGRLFYGCSAQDAAEIGFDDEVIRREVVSPMDARSLQAEQVMRQEALAAFEAWRSKPDKRWY